jgi:hypothetical protein
VELIVEILKELDGSKKVNKYKKYTLFIFVLKICINFVISEIFII